MSQSTTIRLAPGDAPIKDERTGKWVFENPIDLEQTKASVDKSAEDASNGLFYSERLKALRDLDRALGDQKPIAMDFQSGATFSHRPGVN